MPPKRHAIWDMCFILGDKNPGKNYYPVNCVFCTSSWKHGKLDEALKHISQNCPKCPVEYKEFASKELQCKSSQIEFILAKRQLQIPLDEEDTIYPEDSVSQASGPDRQRRKLANRRRQQTQQGTSNGTQSASKAASAQQQNISSNDSTKPQEMLKNPPPPVIFTQTPPLINHSSAFQNSPSHGNNIQFQVPQLIDPVMPRVLPSSSPMISVQRPQNGMYMSKSSMIQQQGQHSSGNNSPILQQPTPTDSKCVSPEDNRPPYTPFNNMFISRQSSSLINPAMQHLIHPYPHSAPHQLQVKGQPIQEMIFSPSHQPVSEPDFYLVKWLQDTNIPLNLLEKPEFLKFIRAISQYNVPSADRLVEIQRILAVEQQNR